MCLRQIAFWLFYGMGKALVPLLRLAFRMQVRGRSTLPRAGGLLILSNHISWCDPPLLGALLPRPVYWLAMKEMFESPLLGPLARSLRCVPVDRQKGDARAVREAVRLLRAGEWVVVFPEGGIRVGEQSAFGGNGEFKEGAAIIARLARVPVAPVRVSGTRSMYDWRNWFVRRPPIRIEFGEPFSLEVHASRQEASETIRQRMTELATRQG